MVHDEAVGGFGSIVLKLRLKATFYYVGAGT
jgi:hypothetical protein